MPCDAMIAPNGGVAELVHCTRLEIGQAIVCSLEGSNPFPSMFMGHVDEIFWVVGLTWLQFLWYRQASGWF